MVTLLSGTLSLKNNVDIRATSSFRLKQEDLKWASLDSVSNGECERKRIPHEKLKCPERKWRDRLLFIILDLNNTAKLSKPSGWEFFVAPMCHKFTCVWFDIWKIAGLISDRVQITRKPSDFVSDRHFTRGLIKLIASLYLFYASITYLPCITAVEGDAEVIWKWTGFWHRRNWLQLQKNNQDCCMSLV